MILYCTYIYKVYDNFEDILQIMKKSKLQSPNLSMPVESYKKILIHIYNIY